MLLIVLQIMVIIYVSDIMIKTETPLLPIGIGLIGCKNILKNYLVLLHIIIRHYTD